jgi:16S rRNA (guanine966-N2)-methyltransferase
MRISSGSLGGRSFESPKGAQTHPMSDRVRGGLFNALGDIEELTVLDGFAGSGALSFEAISRGARNALMLENDHTAQAAIIKAIQALGLASQAKLVKAAAGAWLTTNEDNFDLVLLDPPYDDLQPKLLGLLAACTKPGGVAVLSLPPRAEISLSTNYEVLSVKSYGDAELHFYRRID